MESQSKPWEVKVSKGQSRISAFLILYSSGSTIVTPGFDYDSIGLFARRRKTHVGLTLASMWPLA